MSERGALKDFFLPKITPRYAARVVCVAMAAYLLFGFVLVPMKLRGRSMEPTLKNGSSHLLFGLAYLFSKPEKGDIVGIKLAGRRVILLKRVVALEGEEVSFENGDLYVDGKRVEENYVKGRSDWNLGVRTVAPGKVFVVGDNRFVPIEAHDFGEVSEKRIIGRMVW